MNSNSRLRACVTAARWSQACTVGEEEGARSKEEEADSAESQEGASNLGRRRRPTHNGSDSVTQKGPKPRGPGFWGHSRPSSLSVQGTPAGQIHRDSGKPGIPNQQHTWEISNTEPAGNCH